MPGEPGLLEDFLKTLHEDRLEERPDPPGHAGAGRGHPKSGRHQWNGRKPLRTRTSWSGTRCGLPARRVAYSRLRRNCTEAIGKGQEEWEQKLPLFRMTEYRLTEPATGVPNSFRDWRPLLGASRGAGDGSPRRSFAAYAANGKVLQRKLFVDDALRGLAFVDQCRRRFDVVLMNPPFGYGSVQSKRYGRSKLPDDEIRRSRCLPRTLS